MVEKPEITIVHQLPGRVRLRLSHPPRDPGDTSTRVRQHPGIHAINYTPGTRSFLIRFNPREVSREEIVIRIGYALSLDYDGSPIRILSGPKVRELTNSAVYSALAVAAALLAKSMRLAPRASLAIDRAAGLGTAAAVLHHGWTEVRRKGTFDPEVLSVVYLASAFLRGRVLSAALVTWLTSFGRHLFRPPSRAVELRLSPSRRAPGGTEDYCVDVRPDHGDSAAVRFLRLAPAIVQYALIGSSGPFDNNLLRDMGALSAVHDEVLEGFGEIDRGIPIRIIGLS